VYLSCLYEPWVLSSPHTNTRIHINTWDFYLLGHLKKKLAYSAPNENEKTPRKLNIPTRKQTSLFVQLWQVMSSYLLPLFGTNFTRTLSRIESVSCYEFATYKHSNQTHFSNVITNTHLETPEREHAKSLLAPSTEQTVSWYNWTVYMWLEMIHDRVLREYSLPVITTPVTTTRVITVIRNLRTAVEEQSKQYGSRLIWWLNHWNQWLR
jgi:hypothetical protein